jgi:hypothetical protein
MNFAALTVIDGNYTIFPEANHMLEKTNKKTRHGNMCVIGDIPGQKVR